MSLLRITVYPRLYTDGPRKQVNLSLEPEVYEFLHPHRYELTKQFDAWTQERGQQFGDLAVRWRAGYVGAAQRILHDLYPELRTLWPVVQKAPNGRYVRTND